jgi:hypothetical protein
MLICPESTVCYNNCHKKWGFDQVSSLEIRCSPNKTLSPLARLFLVKPRRFDWSEVYTPAIVIKSALTKFPLYINTFPRENLFCNYDHFPRSTMISMWHSYCMLAFNSTRGGVMNLASIQGTGDTKELRHGDFGTQSLRECFYLLQKSLDRYEYLRESGAPDIILCTEKALIARQLLSLSNLSIELAK